MPRLMQRRPKLMVVIPAHRALAPRAPLRRQYDPAHCGSLRLKQLCAEVSRHSVSPYAGTGYAYNDGDKAGSSAGSDVPHNSSDHRGQALLPRHR